MTTDTTHLQEIARNWAIRLQDPALEDWDEFTAWLESDAAHLAAYDGALDDADWAADILSMNIPEHISEPDLAAEDTEEATPDNVVPLAPKRRWFAIGGAIAASIVGLVSFSVINHNPAQHIITAPGEHRTVALDDGSRVILNGGTKITIDADRPREVIMAHGEALFEVKHDDAHPFVVMANGTRLLDAGTVFNVISDGGALDVAVSHGIVIYEPGSEDIQLNAGDALSRTDKETAPVLRKASPRTIGTWQAGQLQYSNAPLADVARDLSRNLGTQILLSEDVQRLRFSGTIIVDGSPNEVLARTAPLLGVKFTANGKAWTMITSHGAATD